MTSQRLYVGNLPSAAHSDCLKEAFSKYGDVKDVELKTKPNGSLPSSKNFAYIEIAFSSDNERNNCLEQEVRVSGQIVKVQPAKESFLKRLQNEREGIVTQVPHHDAKKLSHLQNQQTSKKELDNIKRMDALHRAQEEKKRQSSMIGQSLHERSKSKIVFDEDYIAEMKQDVQTNGIQQSTSSKIRITENGHHEETNCHDEKSRNMNILGSVLKKPLTDSLSPRKPVLIPRYDPLSANSSKFEIKKRKVDFDYNDSQLSTKKIEKKQTIAKQMSKQRNQEVFREDETEEKLSKSRVSQQRFASVNSNLRDIFSQKDNDCDATPSTGFMFGDLFNAELSNDANTTASNFRYESESTKQKVADNCDVPLDKTLSQSIEVEKSSSIERFFFSKNDPRLLFDPFFKPNMIEKLKKSINSSESRANMNQALAKKKKFAKNRKYIQSLNERDSESAAKFKGKRGNHRE